MRRREFVAGVASGGLAWPLVAGARSAERVRRVGVLLNTAANDLEGQRRLSAFVKGLLERGWAEGDNFRIDTRWSAGDIERARKYATELVALAPDVILASGGVTMQALNQATRTIPIVFTQTADPVGAGYVDSLAQPGGNATGFTQFEYGISAKWLELLKQVAPQVTHAAVLRDPTATSGTAQFAAIQVAAGVLGIAVSPIGIREPSDIQRAVSVFAQRPNSGLIVVGSALAIGHRDVIIGLAARHQIPTVYPFRYFVTAGGLISYGPDTIDPHRRAAAYVDRILKGEKPADLPVQPPTKFEMAINLKTAKALGLAVPQTVLAAADEVIE